MKKLLALLLATAFVIAGIAPAQAGIVWEYDSNWVGQSYPAPWSTMDVNGSLREGETHSVSFSATIPAGATCEIWIVATTGVLFNTQGNTGSVSGSSSSLISGAAGTQQQYWTVFHCTQAVAPTFAGYSSRIAKVTFETPPPPVVVTPTTPIAKPTLAAVPATESSIVGGAQLTIAGTGLSTVTSVTVGGVNATVISKTESSVTIEIPASQVTGSVDIVVSTPQGSVTASSSIVYKALPIVKTKTLTGFTATAKALTAAQKGQVKALLTANPTLTELTCAAKTTGVKASKTELTKATTLAKATCAYAQTLKKSLVTKTSASQTLPKAKASRTVLLTLKN